LKLRALLVALTVVLAIPAISAIADAPVCDPVPKPDIAFSAPKYIDETRAGGEPVSIVAQDGSIIVSAHAGTTHVYKNPDAVPGSRDFLVGYSNQTLHWRSDDGGATWDYTGLLGEPVGPHTPQSTGFSDPDLAIDQGGRIYDVEIDLANNAVFSSVDDGQSWPHGNPMVAPGDRPWLTALEKDEIFLYVNNYPKSGQISRDGGLTWTRLPVPAISSKAVNDPLNRNDGMIGPVGSLGRFAISGDDGQTWKVESFGKLGRSEQFFGVVGVDSAGNVYQSAAGGYGGSDDTTPDGEVTFTYYERATGRTNGQKVIEIPTPPGDALWPWLIAGDKGRAAVVWYQSLAGAPDDFYIFAAVTHNALGTTVNCSDGSTKFVDPQFTVVNASQRPIHHGKICLDGTTCNANPSFEGGDRRLGDFFSVNFDHEGDLFIVSADTMLKNPVGGAKPVGNPIFISQSSGHRMLETPRTLRPTRPVCSNPVTCT
jgi:hypothetical protein